jgi:hypothetical protein
LTFCFSAVFACLGYRLLIGGDGLSRVQDFLLGDDMKIEKLTLVLGTVSIWRTLRIPLSADLGYSLEFGRAQPEIHVLDSGVIYDRRIVAGSGIQLRQDALMRRG